MDGRTDPFIPEPRQFHNKRLFRVAVVIRAVLYFFCVSNFAFLIIQFATAPPRREIVYEERDEVRFPSVRICPMVPEGNVTKPHKAFISRKPGEDYQVPSEYIFPLEIPDHRGPMTCWCLNLGSYKVQRNLPGFRAHIHFTASFQDNAPIVGISFGFYDERYGPMSANITYGLVNHIQYGNVMKEEGPTYVAFTWNGASMPIANDKKGELTILNFDINSEVAIANSVYDWGFWTWVPLLFASFQYRVLYDLIFTESLPPRRRLNYWLTPTEGMRRWLYGPDHDDVFHGSSTNNASLNSINGQNDVDTSPTSTPDRTSHGTASISSGNSGWTRTTIDGSRQPTYSPSKFNEKKPLLEQS